MKFFTRFNPPARKKTVAGSKEIDDYEVRLDKEGRKRLIKKSQKKNIYDRIQAAKEESEVYTIINRFTPEQRKEIITIKASTTSEVYDLTQMPENLIQAKQMQIDAENNWKQLPLELRKEFDHNPDQFIASIQNGTFKEKYEKVFPKPKAKTVETTTNMTTEKETL